MRYRHRPTILLSLTIALSLIPLIGIGVLSAGAADWQGADPIVVISQGRDMQSKDRVSVAVAPEGPLVGWAGGTITQGIYLAEQASPTWPAVHINTQDEAWSSGIAVGDGAPMVVWVQGTNHLDSSTKRSIVAQKMVLGESAQDIATDVYGDGAPSVVAGEEGYHLVYAAAPAEIGNKVPADLYYAFRDYAAPQWTAATIAITHGAVVEDDAFVDSCSVENAQIAVGSATIHVVWEQKQLLPTTTFPFSQVDHSIWYVAGSLSTTPPTWSSPMRISPTSHRIAVRPDVAIDADGEVHVTWTELIGPRDDPIEQHIYHRRVGSSGLTQLNPVGAPIRVNGRFPTKATSAIAARDGLMCVAWHGYYDDGPDTMEDVHMRCSHDAGQSWAIPVTVSQADAQLSSIFPTLDIDAQGKVHVAWAQYELAVTSFVPNSVVHRSGAVSESYRAYLPLVSR